MRRHRSPTTALLSLTALLALLASAAGAGQPGPVVLFGSVRPTPSQVSSALRTLGAPAAPSALDLSRIPLPTDIDRPARSGSSEPDPSAGAGLAVPGSGAAPLVITHFRPALLADPQSRRSLGRQLASLRAGGSPLLAGGAAAEALAPWVVASGAERSAAGGDLDAIHSLAAGSVQLRPGLGLLAGVIVESDTLRRSRLTRLVNGVLHDPSSQGIGLDTDSAVVLWPDGRLEVLDGGSVVVVDADRARIGWAGTGDDPAMARPSADGIALHVLLPGATYDLLAHRPRALGGEAPRGHVIATGGGLPDVVLAKFAELSHCREEPVVVLSLGHDTRDDARREITLLRAALGRYGCNRVEGIDGSDRSALAAGDTLALVRRAGGFFLGGGDQRRVAGLLRGSPLWRALWERYAQGAVVAGGSAGAAVQGDLMITGEGGRLAAEGTAPNPFDRLLAGNVELAPALGFIPGVVVDQHFLERARSNRLLNAILDRQDLIGIGVDTYAAIWLRPDRTLTVLGYGTVMVFLPPRDAARAVGPPLGDEVDLRPIGAAGLALDLLAPGDRFDLRTRRVLPAPGTAPADLGTATGGRR